MSNGHKGWPVIIALGLIAATLLVYSQAGRFDFINFDDDAYVYANAPVRAGLTRAGVLWAFFTIDYFYWQPLTWLSHMLDCELFGLNAGRHHLTSVLFHVMNSLLVFFVFRRMTGAVWRSAMLAALFALHPLRVESVAWIAERKDVLSGFWFLAMLWAYARYTERPSNGRYGLVLGAMLMGLMAKPMLVTAPFLLLLLDYWPLRRVAIAEKAPMLMMAAVSVVLTALGTRQVRAVHAVGIPAGLRLSNAVVSYARYIGKTLWPRDLAILYPYPASIPAWEVWGAVLLLAAVTAAAFWLGRSHRYLPAGWLWFVVGLLPTIGLMQVGRQALADRFTYIPLMGFFAAVVWGAAALVGRHPRASAAGAGIVLAACGMVSWNQARTWRDSVTVFEHALAVTRDNSLAHHDLAVALEARGQRDAAIGHYAEAVRIEPGYFIAHYNYGSALLARGQTAEAAAQFRAAVYYRPDYQDARRRLEELRLSAAPRE
ncbi:MAG TPA: tetratricopeptide repeat protein [Bryobacteraceae bacterium]|nr:tetratricopeptide repeat protein [Bryobacteraceae bacterium]